MSEIIDAEVVDQLDPAQLTLELPIEDSVKLVHPDHYHVIHPNVLISTATSQFTLIEHKLYTEILSIDHKQEPNKFFYRLPYLSVYERTKNPGRNIQRLSESIRGQRLQLPLEYAKKVYGDDLKRSEISSFITVNYRTGYIEVELHRDLKKLLVLTNSHYSKGELELCRSFKSEYSHKIYWIIRKVQPFKSTLTMAMDDFRAQLGIIDKYSDTRNLTRRVLNPAKADLSGTWAAFGFSYVLDGNKAVGIKLFFKSDKKLSEYQERDLRYEYENHLSKAGVDVSFIMKYRKLILEEEVIDPKVSPMKWNFYYISRTVQEVINNKKVKHSAAFIVDSLNKGRYLKPILKELNDLLLEGIEKNPFGKKFKEGVQIRKKIVKMTQLMTREEYEKDADNFGKTIVEYLEAIDHHEVKYKGKRYSVSKEIVPEDVKTIDDWKVIDDLEY